MSGFRTLLPLHLSPIRQAREKLNLSLHGAAEKAKVNYQTWYLTECACYSEIPPAILYYLEDAGFNPFYLNDKYKAYVLQARKDFYANYQEKLYVYSLIEHSSAHPVVQFREYLGLSRQALAKELCVQPAVLYKLESGRSRKLPKQLKTALLEAGLPDNTVCSIERELTAWLKRN